MNSPLGSHIQTLRPLTLLGDDGPLLVFDHNTNQEWVLKSFYPSGLNDEESFALEQHLNFLEHYRKVKHKNLSQIGHIIEDGDGFLTLSTFEDGTPLSEICSEHVLNYRDFREFAKGLLNAISALHRNEIVHGDVTPRVVLIDAEEGGLLSVKLVEPSPLRKMSVVKNHRLKLKRINGQQYSSPEKWANQPLQVADDFFALGCVFYFALAGKGPFAGDSSDAIQQAVSTHDYIPLHELRPDLPKWLTGWVEGFFAMQASDRPKSADEAIDVLFELAHEDPEAANRARTRRPAEGVPPVISLNQLEGKRRRNFNEGDGATPVRRTPQPMSTRSVVTERQKLRNQRTSRTLLTPQMPPDMERLNSSTTKRYATPITELQTDLVGDHGEMWHYTKGGKVVMGPVTEDEVLYLFNTGELGLKDPVWTPSQKEWRRLQDSKILERAKNRGFAMPEPQGLLPKILKKLGLSREVPRVMPVTSSPEPPKPASRKTALFLPNSSLQLANVAKEWHYSQDGNVFGPISEIELRGLVEKGTLSQNDLVWTGSFPQWRRIRDTRIIERAKAVSEGISAQVPQSQTRAVARVFSIIWFEFVIALALLMVITFAVHADLPVLHLRSLLDCGVALLVVGWFSLKIRAASFDVFWFGLALLVPVVGDVLFFFRNPFVAWKGLLVSLLGVLLLFIMGFHPEYQTEVKQAKTKEFLILASKLNLMPEVE